MSSQGVEKETSLRSLYSFNFLSIVCFIIVKEMWENNIFYNLPITYFKSV